MLTQIGIYQDFIFGGLASAGFAMIANVRLNALPYCGFIAAAGHALRYQLIHNGGDIVSGSFCGALVIGLLAVVCSRMAKSPAESLSYPALLPMIPGMYAYKAVHAAIGCMQAASQEMFEHNLYLLQYNSMMTFFVISSLVLGITLPVFALKKMTFEATRKNYRHGTTTNPIFYKNGRDS